MLIRFAVNSYRSQSLPISAQQCVNFYAEQEPPDAKTPVAVFAVPGLSPFAVCGAGPVRGMHVLGSLLYVVSGQTLYSVTQAGVATPLGSAVSGSGVVNMSDNGTQLCIVNGVSGYIYSAAGGFQLISSLNFHAANTVSFFDTYFVFDWAGTNQFFISSPLDGTVYDALDFASAESHPDNVIAVLNQQQNLLIFGQKSIETWYDAGAADFPFRRYDGATIERGCAAAQSILREDNSVFFLGDDLVYYRLDGVSLKRVSTHAMEFAWSQYATTSDAFAFSYTYEGHKFIALTFPAGGATWEYDIATNLWHERDSRDVNNNSLGRWRGNAVATFANHTLIGDAYSGGIGFVDRATFTELSNPLYGMATSPSIHSDRKRIFMSRFELDMETGVGVTTGQGSDPQVMLDWSVDGGRSYGALQRWNSLGRIGEYSTRLRWLRLGQARQRVLRIHISDPVPRVILSAHADIGPGM